MQNESLEYAGFWVRVGAALIDTLCLMVVICPPLVWIYGWAYFTGGSNKFVEGPADFLLSWVFPAVAVILFWRYKRATPGKLVLGLEVIDTATGNALTLGQSIIRYLGYYVSLVPLGLGLLWVAFDAKKQGWHDKIAGTVVIHAKTAVTTKSES